MVDGSQSIRTPRTTYIQLATSHLQVELDDDDATLVFVFDRPGINASKKDHEIPKPSELIKRIFPGPNNQKYREALPKGDSMKASEFNTFCMKTFIQILKDQKFKVSEPIESVDKDELFVKVALKQPELGHLAELYEYKVPLMRPAEGSDAPIYMAYDAQHPEDYQDFRAVDEVRIARRLLHEWVSVTTLLNQRVLTKWFVGPHREEEKLLQDEWGSWRKVFHLPNYEYDQKLRDYFGEEITFFFRWLAFYTRMLLPLGFLGGLCFLAKLGIFHPLPSSGYTATLEIIFAFLLVAWASIYNEMVKNNDARATQRWGTQDAQKSQNRWPEYDPEKEGKWALWFQSKVPLTASVLWCILFSVAIFYCERWKRRHQNSDLVEQFGDLSSTVLIYAFSLSWGKIAPRLANLENHATEYRWINSYSMIVAGVSLFLALFPFIYVAFLQKYAKSYCADTLELAAHRAYHSTAWPVNSTSGDLSWLDGFWDQDATNAYCIYGCFPKTCHQNEDSTWHCKTQCEAELESSLLMFYVTKCCTVMGSMLLPIFQAKWMVDNELRGVPTQAGETGTKCGTVMSSMLLPIYQAKWLVDTLLGRGGPTQAGETGMNYSHLQLQAKLNDVVDSSQRAIVDDFMRLATGFAVLTCFGNVVPVMSLIGFGANVVLYRVLAYRLTRVTCRPYPAPAAGIGAWQTILETTSTLAVTVNVGLAVFVREPLCMRPLAEQLAWFIVLERAMLVLKSSVAAFIPDMPRDVQHREDLHNAEILERQLKRRLQVKPTN